MKYNPHGAWRAVSALVCVCATLIAVAEVVESEVTVRNSAAGVTLGGTISVPAQGAPRAAVVLATGSGAQNRDEEMLGLKPFKVLADHLSEAGYAVLRMDDRGVGQSTGDASAATIDDYVGDIAAAFAALDSCLGARIPKGIIGHSEGGTAAIKGAKSIPGCAFIVTMAAPAWPGDSIIMSQARAMATAMSGTWDGEASQRRFLDMVKGDMPAFMLRPALYAEVASMVGDAAALPAVQRQINAQVDAMCSPAYRSLVRYNPEADIRAADVPWLALNGDRDMQVLPENLATIAGLNSGAVTRLLPGHNHLFQECRTGSPAEYATRPAADTPSATTLAAITGWLATIIP